MNFPRVTFGFALLMLWVTPWPAHAQRQISIEIHGGGGVTAVDVQEASGQTSEVRGEDTGMYQFFGRVFFADLGAARLGVEVGYQYLYFYEAPFIGFLDRDIDAMRYAAVLRYPLAGRLIVEAGAGIHSFEGGSVFSTLGALGVDLSVAPRIAVPIRARADFVIDDALTIPVGATIGLALRL
jgi:hypothetical protein